MKITHLFGCLLVGVLAVSLASPVFADDTSTTTTTTPKKRRHFKRVPKPVLTEPIPDADSCGLGWQVTQKRTLSAVTTRATTNLGTILPSFGMTSGTIGCKQMPLSEKDEIPAKFAYNNFSALTIEMAEGQGEFLRGFAETLGCEDAAYPEFAKMTQTHYRTIMDDGKASSLEMFQRVKGELGQDPLLSAGCSGA